MSPVKWGGDEFVKRSLLPSVEDGLVAAGTAVQAAIRTSINGPGPSAPGTPPGARTGSLRNSVSVAKTRPLSVGIGTNLRYAKPLEFGAVVRSKTGKYLTIPLNKRAEFIRKRNRSLRDVPGLVSITSKKGNVLLGFRKAGKFEPMFVLKKQVTILARPWLRPGLRNNRQEAQAAFSERVRSSLRQRAQVALRGA